MNDFETDMPGTAARTSAERHIEGVREQGGIFVEAVRVTRMPMLVTEATLPGNPIVFANAAFMNVSGYSLAELVGQDGEQSCTAGRAAFITGRGPGQECLPLRPRRRAVQQPLFAAADRHGRSRHGQRALRRASDSAQVTDIAEFVRAYRPRAETGQACAASAASLS